jgi:RNA polymerase sigma-70 factor (ECF subfamily)
MSSHGEKRVQAPSHTPAQPSIARGADAALSDFDTQLMLRVREGDRESAELIIRRNFDRVSRFIGRMVRDRRGGNPIVEDLTHDVFLRILSSSSRYVPTARFSTFLYRVATNVALNYLDQAHLRYRASQAEDSEAVSSQAGEDAPDQQLATDDVRRAVQAAIRSLPTNQRLALTLFEYEGFSYEQISEVTDFTVEAVRALLLRARNRLRELLRELA